MIDDRTRPRAPEDRRDRTEKDRRTDYEPPALTIIGPLEEITLGGAISGGDMAHRQA